MRRILLSLLAIAGTPFSAFATDGQVLINQSTVMATGGFPYTITQAGSYKLSGNLVAPSDKQAILIAVNEVVLDLNGFNVTCSFVTGHADATNVCVGTSGSIVSLAVISDVVVRNGMVNQSLNLSPAGQGGYAVSFLNSNRVTVEDLHIVVNIGGALLFQLNSIIRHNIIAGGITLSCPSLIEGNIYTGPALGGPYFGCVLANNIGF